MDFDIDSQTISDLNIFNSSKNEKSVFDFFSMTKTHGGKIKLKYMLSNPLSDITLIEHRQESIAFFQKNKFKLNKEDLDFIDYYLYRLDYPVRKISKIEAMYKALKYKIRPTKESYIIENAVTIIIGLILAFQEFFSKENLPEAICESRDKFNETLGEKVRFEAKILSWEIIRLDYRFRYRLLDYLRSLLQLAYEYDALMTVASIAANKKMVFPKMLPASENVMEIDGLTHLLLENPVANSVNFSEDKNIMFITGPNMAGKSTFMKSLGVAVYLSHIGFPVSAVNMRLSVLEGVSSTINLADNLASNESHFYAEVNRIKKVALTMKKRGRMLILFDELFRGTNIKDAYDGSLAVIKAFTRVKSSFIAVSTHIVEVAEQLKAINNISFKCFHGKILNAEPVYSYKIQEGVSEDRLGMYIIEKENIINTILSINNETI